MLTNEILEALDAQINKLQQARAILIGASAPTTGVAVVKRRGRPRGSANKPVPQAAPAVPIRSPKRTISPEGKARIVAALKARWAAKRKADKTVADVASKSLPAVAKKAPKPSLKPTSTPVKKAAAAKNPSKQLAIATAG